MTAQPPPEGQARRGDPPIVTRFAPSPTGRLHLGHAASAIRAHDLARGGDGDGGGGGGGGAFLLRIEDIDAGRCRPAFVEGITEDLAWLGLTWDGPVVRQSDRLELHADALERLRAQGLLYPCFCTRGEIAREIAASASAPHAEDTEPRYPGTCRSLSFAERQARMDRRHAWRLDSAAAIAAAGPLAWHDSGAGRVVADPADHGDVVLARKDAPASYHLAVTVDDAAQGVTDVVRGQDLFAATHVHRLLQALLGLPTPRYRHHPLLLGPDGIRLAKRHGAPTLAAMRADGVDGRKIADLLRQGNLPAGLTGDID